MQDKWSMQFKCQNSSISCNSVQHRWGATTPGLSGPSSDGNEGVLCIPQSSSITGTSQSDWLVSYPGHMLKWGYSSAEKQSDYSTIGQSNCINSSTKSHSFSQKYQFFKSLHSSSNSLNCSSNRLRFSLYRLNSFSNCIILLIVSSE